MKAKVWAQRFRDCEPASIQNELKDFIGEIGEVAKKRGGTLNAIEGAVREQRQKYQVICDLYPDLSHFPFDVVLAEFGSEFAEKETAAQLHFRKHRLEGSKTPRRQKI